MSRRVLVVDDERSITMMLRMILTGEGHEVDTASSAAEAQRILTNGAFDVVITDMRMETPTAGMEVAGFARECKSHPSVVILSAFPMQTNEWVGFADAYLQKGGSIRDLIEVVDTLMRYRAA